MVDTIDAVITTIRGHEGHMVDTIDAAIQPFEDMKVTW